MCLPVIAAAAVVSAAGAITQGINAARIGRAQQAFAEEEAKAERAAALDAEMQSRANARREIGRQTALFAKSGVRVDTGSPLEVLVESATNAEADAQAIRRGGERRAERLRVQGALAAAEGRSQLIGSAFKAGATVLQGYTKLQELKGS